MGRKRANVTKDKNTAIVKPKPRARPLQQTEAQYFQELLDVSNRYAALEKQKAQYEFILKKLEENRKKIQTGEVPLPVTLALIPKVMYYQENDKKKIFKLFDEQIESYKNMIKAIEGQLEHRYEEYSEVAVKNREYWNKRFEFLKATKMINTRKELEDEDNLFEAEFKDLIQNSDLQKEYQKAKKEAIKKNTARQTKKTG